jgi:hypothetical protein
MLWNKLPNSYYTTLGPQNLYFVKVLFYTSPLFINKKLQPIRKCCPTELELLIELANKNIFYSKFKSLINILFLSTDYIIEEVSNIFFKNKTFENFI